MNLLNVTFTPKEYERIFKNINKTSSCWLWTGAIDSAGYAQGFYRGKKEKVHRLVYASIRGPIPTGEFRKYAQLDHICKNRLCCNPKHIELVSQRINILRGSGVTADNAKKTTCIYGHNLRYTKSGKRRYCPTCDSLHHKKRLQGPQREYWLQKGREAANRWYRMHK